MRVLLWSFLREIISAGSYISLEDKEIKS
jgi:hypothetical protein